MRKDLENTTEDRAFERYSTLAEKIRGWLIAYGVSIAGLFITQESTFARLSCCAKLWILVPSFLGVFIQLMLVMSIKYLNLVVYKAYSDDEPLSKDGRIYKIADWWSQVILVDVVADVATVLFYTAATLMLIFGLTD